MPTGANLPHKYINVNQTVKANRLNYYWETNIFSIFGSTQGIFKPSTDPEPGN
jgi:hypothetical protein